MASSTPKSGNARPMISAAPPISSTNAAYHTATPGKGIRKCTKDCVVAGMPQKKNFWMPCARNTAPTPTRPTNANRSRMAPMAHSRSAPETWHVRCRTHRRALEVDPLPGRQPCSEGKQPQLLTVRERDEQDNPLRRAHWSRSGSHGLLAFRFFNAFPPNHPSGEFTSAEQTRPGTQG